MTKLKALGRLRLNGEVSGSKDLPISNFPLTILLPVICTLCSLQPSQTWTTWSCHRQLPSSPHLLVFNRVAKVEITYTAGGLRERSSLCIELRATSYTYHSSLLAYIHVHTITAILTICRETTLEIYIIIELDESSPREADTWRMTTLLKRHFPAHFWKF